MSPVVVGISTKSYLGYRRSLEWIGEVAAIARDYPEIRDETLQVFLAPSTPLLESAVRLTADTGVRIAAQDASAWPAGAHTGEVPATLLAELGVSVVEIGHAERRADQGETESVIRTKILAAQEAGLTPLLCVGEPGSGSGAVTANLSDPGSAAAVCLEQIAAATAGPLLIAYEPVWAIGAADPASPEYVVAVVESVKAGLPRALAATPVIYGGSAGPGLLSKLRPSVDGLFLGRFAHDPANVRRVLDEAVATVR